MSVFLRSLLTLNSAEDKGGEPTQSTLHLEKEITVLICFIIAQKNFKQKSHRDYVLFAELQTLTNHMFGCW